MERNQSTLDWRQRERRPRPSVLADRAVQADSACDGQRTRTRRQRVTHDPVFRQ
jgi:hypothetical protein